MAQDDGGDTRGQRALHADTLTAHTAAGQSTRANSTNTGQSSSTAAAVQGTPEHVKPTSPGRSRHRVDWPAILIGSFLTLAALAITVYYGKVQITIARNDAHNNAVQTCISWLGTHHTSEMCNETIAKGPVQVWRRGLAPDEDRGALWLLVNTTVLALVFIALACFIVRIVSRRFNLVPFTGSHGNFDVEKVSSDLDSLVKSQVRQQLHEVLGSGPLLDLEVYRRQRTIINAVDISSQNLVDELASNGRAPSIMSIASHHTSGSGRGEPPIDPNGRYVCNFSPDCKGLTFDRKCEWSKHMDKHDRPYRCEKPECAKLPGFTYSGGLLRHEREVHNKHGGPRPTLRCPYANCKRATGRGFTRRENLSEHIRRAHGTDPMTAFQSSKTGNDDTALHSSAYSIVDTGLATPDAPHRYGPDSTYAEGPAMSPADNRPWSHTGEDDKSGSQPDHPTPGITPSIGLHADSDITAAHHAPPSYPAEGVSFWDDIVANHNSVSSSFDMMPSSISTSVEPRQTIFRRHQPSELPHTSELFRPSKEEHDFPFSM